MKTKVLLREENIMKLVDISDEDKPIISGIMELKWQRIINIIGKFLNVPCGLIMRITKENMQVFLKSENIDNPYSVGSSDTLGRGLYCETVIGRNEPLLVENALEDKVWEENPDVKLKMIAYYGLPIRWPDHSFFGTICVLDSKKNSFGAEYKELMAEFCDTLERDLEILVKNTELEFLALYDQLTTVYNRRKLETTLEYEFNRYLRTKSPYSVIIFDLDKFKMINDVYGHDIGDKVLIAFSEAVRSSVRSIDIFGRWGGDEFLLICPETTYDQACIIIEKIHEHITGKINQVIKGINQSSLTTGFSYGIAMIESKYSLPHDLVINADNAMYQMKKNKSNR